MAEDQLDGLLQDPFTVPTVFQGLMPIHQPVQLGMIAALPRQDAARTAQLLNRLLFDGLGHGSLLSADRRRRRHPLQRLPEVSVREYPVVARHAAPAVFPVRVVCSMAVSWFVMKWLWHSGHP
ncbi:hypothetical protein WJ438_10990 [Streptomyces sp. GD-15H]|uniref:hypothetical protein n=1 Tax=Streptomyces sp. GD-15H TaxID=3129112 RepID=UPI0032568EC3